MKARVLLIDDDPTHLDVLTDALRYCGFTVRARRHGKNLSEDLMRFKPDLMLTDYRLPGPDGQQLCRKVREDPGHSNVPVILMSAYPLEAEDLSCFDLVLQKPLDLDPLLDHIFDLLPPGLSRH